MINYAKSAVVKRCSSSLTLDKLLYQIGRLSSKKDTIQIFDSKKVINRMHLVGAYANAVEAFRNRSNISKSMGVEMLLFAAMTTQITLAIETVGAKTSRDFIVFSSSKRAYQRARSLMSSEKEFNPARKDQARAARLFGIDQKSDLDGFILQKIAVSRLEG